MPSRRCAPLRPASSRPRTCPSTRLAVCCAESATAPPAGESVMEGLLSGKIIVGFPEKLRVAQFFSALLGLLALAGVFACTGARGTPATRYLGLILNARGLGADELARAGAEDPTLRTYLAQHGGPDFLLVPSAQ